MFSGQGEAFSGGIFSGGARPSECEIYTPYKAYMRTVVSPAWYDALQNGEVNKRDNFTQWYKWSRENSTAPKFEYFRTHSYPAFLDFYYPSNDRQNGELFQKYKMDYLKTRNRKQAAQQKRIARGQGLVVGEGQGLVVGTGNGLVVGEGQGFPKGVVPEYCRGRRRSSGHLSGYQAYVKEVYDQAKAEFPNLLPTQLMAKIGETWHSLTNADRDGWAAKGARIAIKPKSEGTGRRKAATRLRGRKKIYKRGTQVGAQTKYTNIPKARKFHRGPKYVSDAKAKKIESQSMKPVKKIQKAKPAKAAPPKKIAKVVKKVAAPPKKVATPAKKVTPAKQTAKKTGTPVGTSGMYSEKQKKEIARKLKDPAEDYKGRWGAYLYNIVLNYLENPSQNSARDNAGAENTIDRYFI